MRHISDVLAPDAVLERIGGGATWSEGPCWIESSQTLRWSDIHGNRILECDPLTGETSEYRRSVDFTNGRTVHPEGYVLQCSHGRRRVEADVGGDVTPVASGWNGGRFNSPNDIVVASDRSIWFTDPHYGITVEGEGHPGEMEYGGCFVFRLPPATFGPEGAARYSTQERPAEPVITDMEEPNGLAFSPDESVLYVSDTSAVRRPEGVGNHHVRAYDVVHEDGALRCVNGRTLFEIPGGLPDGIRVDEHGRIWSSGPAGVTIFSAEGETLGHIAVPELVGNLCFGGPSGTDLFIAATTSIYRIRTTVRDAAALTR